MPAAEAAAERQPLATYRDGSVSREAVEQWRRCRRLEGRRQDRPLREDIEDLLLEQTLAARFAAADPGNLLEEERRSIELEVATRSLRRALRDAAEPSEEELRQAFERHPEAFLKPRRWRLANLYKGFPEGASEADKERLRAQMGELRYRAESGEEDFADLARRESESSTRLRGGAMGFVTRDRVRPEVAAVLPELVAGELSPVIETAQGLTLLLCTQVSEAAAPSFEEAAPRLRERLRKARFEAEWQHASGAVLAEARRRGLADEPDSQALLACRVRARQAQKGANLSASGWVEEPTEEELRRLFEQRGKRLKVPQRLEVRALHLALDETAAPATLERFELLAQQLAAGEIAWPEAAVLPGVRAETWGWLTAKQLWLRGLNVDAAVQALPVGGTTPVVQESRRLYVLQLLDETPERCKTYDEARPDLRDALLAGSRRQAGRRLRREVLAELAIELSEAAAAEPVPAERPRRRDTEPAEGTP